MPGLPAPLAPEPARAGTWASQLQTLDGYPPRCAGYSPVNGEIYRHEVLGEADPRPCDLKTVTASRVRMSRAQTGSAGREQEVEYGHWAFAGPPSGDSPNASCVGKADGAPGSPPSSRPHKEPGKPYL